MTASEFIADATLRQLDRFFEVVHTIPADKLDWKPGPNSRSVLDQVQEIATAFRSVPEAVKNRKLHFTDEDFAKWQVERQAMTNLAELEKMAREGTATLVEFIRTVGPDEFDEVVQMPWPGDFRVSSLLNYHLYNLAYHEGQVYMIGTLIQNS